MKDGPGGMLLKKLSEEYLVYLVRPQYWGASELGHLRIAVEDLAALMGGPGAFRRELGRVFLWRAPFRTAMAAMAVPLVDVVYFRGASWGDAPELKWQTVHELAHVWDISSFYRLSRGLKRATGGRYGRFRWQLPIPFEYHPGGDWLKGRPPPLNGLEDWADSVATYVYPDHAETRVPVPRLISPARWKYVAQQMRVQLPYPLPWLPRFHVSAGAEPPDV